MLEKLSASSFKDLVGSDVNVTVMNGPNLTLTIKAVNERAAQKDTCPPEGCRTGFSLILTGPEHHQVPDGVYSLDFGKLGTLDGIYVDNKADNPDGKPDEQSAAAADGTSDAAEVKYEIVFS